MALLARTAAEHDYRTCGDPDCPRFPCRLYREGRADGYSDGFIDGEAAGFTAGFTAGASSAASSSS